jgi:hypothetical protein
LTKRSICETIIHMLNRSRWEIFQGRPNLSYKGGLRVTLSPKKVFLLNEEVYNALKRPAAVELRFDPETRTIGLAPIDHRNSRAFPIKGKLDPKKYNYHFVQAAPFCKHYQINPRRTMLFTNIDMDNEGTLLLELNTAVAIGRGSR